MASQLQLRRGTTAQTQIFTGAPAEVTVDTDKKTIVVHDGTTQGGFPLALDSVLASGSTTARTLSDRFAETVKVADFGAIGDGITDDANAIQAAITYAVSRGNAVIEFEPKTYNLISTRPYPVPGQYPIWQNRCHLHVSGGTDSTQLIFRGNGAKLYTNVAASNLVGEVLLVASRLWSIDFYDLTFERGPAPRNSIPPQDGSSLFAMMPVATGPIDHVGFYAVNFINGMAIHMSNRAYSVSKTKKKIRMLTTSNCNFLYPYGGNTTFLNQGGASQMVNLSSWIDTHTAYGCHIDGAVGGTRPPWTLAVDGWNYFNAYHTNITDCHFRNTAVEAVICEAVWNIVGYFNAFTQPAVGNTVTLTAKSAQDNTNEELYVGQLYLVRDTNYPTEGYTKPWAIGVYRLESWQNPIVGGSTIVLRRVSDFHAISPEPVSFQDNEFPVAGTVFSNNCQLVMLDQSDCSAHISGCTFTGESILDTNGQIHPFQIVVTNGGSGYTSAPTVTVSHGSMTATAVVANGQVTGVNFNYYDFTKYNPNNPPTLTFSGGGGNGAAATVFLRDDRIDPAIVLAVPGTITNCYFEGNSFIKTWNLSSFTRMGSVNICNNVFYFKGVSKIPNVRPKIPSALGAPWSIISNNSFITDDANALAAFLSIFKSHQLISNNSFVARFAATGGHTASGVITANTNSDTTWQTYVDNNYFQNLNFGVSGNSPCQVGTVRGTFLNKPVSFDGGQFSGSELFLVSANGERKTLTVTNDGEIQITQ